MYQIGTQLHIFNHFGKQYVINLNITSKVYELIWIF